MYLSNEAAPQTDEGNRTQMNTDKHGFFYFLSEKISVHLRPKFCLICKNLQVQGFQVTGPFQLKAKIDLPNLPSNTF